MTGSGKFKYIVSAVLLAIPAAYGQWSSDIRLSQTSGEAFTSFSNAKSIAARGNYVYAVWFDSRHGLPNREIYFRRSADGGLSWLTEYRLTNDGAYSGFPSIAVNGTYLHVVWFDDRDGADDTNVYYKRSTDGGNSWSGDTPLTNHVLMQDFPAVSADGGDVHVVYPSEQDNNWEIYHRRSTDYGVTWDPEVRLTDDPQRSNHASVVACGQYVHVVWSDDRAQTGYFDAYYKRSTDRGGTWSPDFRLTYSQSGNAPCLAVAGPNLNVVWQDDRDGNPEIYYKCSTDNGATWQADMRLTDDPALSYLPCAAAWNSNVHVVWYDYRSSLLAEIYYKRTTDQGMTWGPDTRLTVDSLRSWWPSICVGDSIVHVVWSDDRPGNYNVYYKRNPTGNQPGVTEVPATGYAKRAPGIVVRPNPFTRHAAAPGREKETFIVYDAAGRIVGRCPGAKIGGDLNAGVYFIRGESGMAATRIVKSK